MDFLITLPKVSMCVIYENDKEIYSRRDRNVKN